MFAFIGIPAISAALFMVAGLLIGYLLWHRDRTADKRALKIAEQKVQHARHVARLRKTAFIQLRDASSGNAELPSEPADSRSDPLSPPACDEQEEVRDVKTRQAETRLAEQRQTIRRCHSQIEQLSQIRDRLATTNYELTRQRDDHAHELERIRPQLDTATKQCQDLQDRLEETQRERLAAEKTRDEQRSEIVRLRQEQATTNETHQQTTRELSDVRNINEQLQAAIDEQTAEFEELTQRLADKAQVEEKLEEADRTLQSLTSELESREETITEQRQTIEAAKREKSQLVDQIDALQPLAMQLPERQAEVERLRESIDLLESDELQPLRKQLAGATEELHLKANRTRELLADLQQQTSAAGEFQSRAQQMEEERNVLQRSNEKLKQRLAELTTSVRSIEQQLRIAEEQNQRTMAAQADAAEKTRHQAERIAKLQDEVKRAEFYREKVGVFEAKVRQLTAALRQVGGEQQVRLQPTGKTGGPTTSKPETSGNDPAYRQQPDDLDAQRFNDPDAANRAA